MSNWLDYDDFVDRLRNYHHDNFTGLVTGVSDEQHSFQLGFQNGQVVLLSYRILKGNRALEKLSLLNRVKITEHRNTEIPATQTDLPDTSTVLSRLTVNTREETLTDISHANAMGESESQSPSIDSTAPATEQQTSTSYAAPDSQRLKVIKNAAIHHFGPIGAMVCDEYLSSPNLTSVDLATLLHRIAEEVGASETATEAFLKSVG